MKDQKEHYSSSHSLQGFNGREMLIMHEGMDEGHKKKKGHMTHYKHPCIGWDYLYVCIPNSAQRLQHSCNSGHGCKTPVNVMSYT